MEQTVRTGELIELVGLCASARDEAELFESALPVLRMVVAADGVAVLDAQINGVGVTFADGWALPPAPCEPPPADTVSWGSVPVPLDWKALGVRRVVAMRLAGPGRTLALTWVAEEPHEDESVLGAALDIVAMAAGRLRVSGDLADLTQRVDNAQHLASMGDYDWHIPTDTNQWSDQLYRIYGHEPQSFNASYERFLSCLHPEDRERIQAVHQEAYATGEPYQMIERIVRPDGELRYLSSNGEVIMDESGTPVRMRGTCIDITERVLAEQERERVSERFRGLVEAAPDAILVSDHDGAVVQANTRAVDLLGGDPTGRMLTEILPAGNRGGQAVAAVSLGGDDLILDLVTAELSETDRQQRTASFLWDAAPRLEREAMATRLGELQQRRRQALEINDNVVQGLSSAVYALEQQEYDRGGELIGHTLRAARNMMDDLLDPSGQQLGPGDLIRASSATLKPNVQVLAHLEESGRPAAEAHRILIVDDAEDIRLLLRLKLNSHERYSVVGEAVDGVDAVDQARALQPHLVLLDMAMPRMDGLQALPLIRDAVPNVRVIVLSGFNQGTLEEEALAAGADRYIVKGGPLSELLDIIATVLDAA